MTYAIWETRVYRKFLHQPCTEETYDSLVSALSEVTYIPGIGQEREQVKQLIVGMMQECRSKIRTPPCLRQ